MKKTFTLFINALALIVFSQISATSQIVWGANGEGEFDGGLGEWYTQAADTLDIWVHEADATANFRQVAIQSASAANGCAHLDLATLTCAIIDCNDAGPPPYPWHNTILTSPPIDLSMASTPVLRFTQVLDDLNAYANNGGFFVYLSNDGGVSWVDTIALEKVNETNGDVVLTEELSFPITSIAGEANAAIGFASLNADFYAWMIDDVVIANEAISDGVVPEGWFATAPNWRTPASQVDLIPFMADVESRGNVGVDNAVLTATIDGPSGNEFSGTLDYGNLEPTTNYWNVVWDEFYEMSNEEGEYTITYELNSDSEDSDLSNNTVSSNFIVGGDTFNKVIPEAEAGANYLVGLSPGGGNLYNSYANAYYVPAGEGWQARSISCGLEFGSNATIQPATLVAELYLWIDDGDGIAAATNEKFKVASGEYFVDPDNINFFELRNIEIPLNPDGAETLELTNNAQYIAVVHVNPLTPDDFNNDPIGFLGMFVETNRSYSYGPMQFAFENSGTQVRRYGSMWAPDGVDGTPSDNANRTLTSGISTQVTWYIPMEIAVFSDAEDINNNLKVSAYPNPATDMINVDLELENVSSTVSLELMNIEGKVVNKQLEQNVKNGTYSMPLHGVDAGIYLLRVGTEDGSITKRVIVQ